jgi:hypothetical protein
MQRQTSYYSILFHLEIDDTTTYLVGLDVLFGAGPIV